MARASFTWNNFSGGEWSQNALGRIDLPEYKTALSTSQHALLMEEGAWTRRPGRRRHGTTHNNHNGCVRNFWLPNHQPCILEITYGSPDGAVVRFWTQQIPGMFCDDFTLLCDSYTSIASISGATPAILTLNSAVSWATGDHIQIFPDPTFNNAPGNGAGYTNREFVVTKVDTTHFTLVDAYTGNQVNGADPTLTFSGGVGTAYAGHIYKLAGPWNSVAEVQSLRLYQVGGQHAFITSGTGASPVQELVQTSNSPPTFTLAPAAFIDGPYLDPLPGSSHTGNSKATLTTNWGAGPTATLVLTNGSDYSFTNNDVGRAIRVWCQPQPWVSGSYTGAGGVKPRVAWQGNFYALVNATSDTPGTSANWTIQPDCGRWGFGLIQSVTNSSTVVIQFTNIGDVFGGLDQPTTNANGANSGGTAQTTATIDTWQLGVYTVNQYPTCGVFHEGRLWLTGAIPNRFDACMSDGGSVAGAMTMPATQNSGQWPTGGGNNSALTLSQAVFGAPQWGMIQNQVGTLASDPQAPLFLTGITNVYFSPSDFGGNVRDNHGISYTIAAPGDNQMNFMIPNGEGLVCGTKAGEVYLFAPSNTSGMTPSNIADKRTTEYKSSFVEPLRVGFAVLFAQAQGQTLMEYVIDTFSRHFIGRHLNLRAKHLLLGGIRELAYQEEKTPTVWVLMQNGTLATCNYRRVSPWGQEPPQMMGWCSLPLNDNSGISTGSSTAASSITMSADLNSNERLVLLTEDLRNSRFQIESFSPTFGLGMGNFDAFFVDGGTQSGWGPGPSGSGTFSALPHPPAVATINGGITFYGYQAFIGERVRCWVAGLDCGNATVATNGTVFVPWQSDPDGLLTLTYLQNLPSPANRGGAPLFVNVDWTDAQSVNHRVVIPAAIGFFFQSLGQLPRVNEPNDAKAPTGPTLGERRRIAQVSMLLQQSSPPNLGTSAANAQAAVFRQDDETTPALLSKLYNGVFWGTINASWDFDNQLRWDTSGAGPLTVVSVGGFMETGEREQQQNG